MRLLVFLLLSLWSVVWCGEECLFANEICTCSISDKTMDITCRRIRSDTSQLPVEFRSLSLDFNYEIIYSYKNMPRIESNSSLSRVGLRLDSLDLSSNRIKIIERGAFDNTFITILILNNNTLTSLDFLASSICDVIVLRLDFNNIEYLDSNWFNCHTKLSDLRISYNNLRTIESGVMSSLINIQIIVLQYNNIEVIKSEAFSNLSKLTQLTLCHNMIREIHLFAFNNLSSLKSIECLEDQYIETLQPYALNRLDKLGSISFQNNRLTSLSPDSFVGLTSVTELKLQRNLLRAVDSRVLDKMPKLEGVNISMNYLTKIHVGLVQGLTNMASLDFKQNEIEIIEPYSFIDQTESLQKLYLAQNKLNFIKKSHFSMLRALQTLSLSYNQISSIEPGSFDKTTSLLYLYLDHNCIHSIHRDLFKGLNQLSELNMGNNVILKLDGSVFRNLIKLTVLNLSYNQIETLYELIFQDLKNLKVLDLSNNRLKNVASPLIFQGLVSLQTICLSKNLIENISFQTLSASSQTLTSLYLDSNRLVDFKSSSGQLFSSLRVVDFSSNLALSNATGLSKLLENCSLCLYEIKLRNVSSSFVNEFIYFMNKSTLVYQINKLDLSYNYIGSLLDIISFKSMVYTLAEMNLKSTNFTSSLSFLNELTYFRSLDLSDNQMVFNKQHFSKKTLTRLHLSNTGLKDIDSELATSALDKLVDVDLSRNLIEVVRTKDFGSCVERLNLSHNRIRFIDTSAFDTSELVDLDLSNNLLTSLSYKIFELESYTPFNFHLDNNMLESYSISGEIYFNDLFLNDNYIQHIVNASSTLILDRNNLTSIQSVTSSSTGCYIIELSIVDNQIIHIEDGSFSNCRFLSNLDLSMNMISNMSSNTFRGLIALTSLNLSSNMIEFISDQVFMHFKILNKLDLNGNKIKFIMDKSFTRSYYLELLYLDSLEMTVLTNNTFEGIPSVKFLNMNSAQFDSIQNIKMMAESFSKEFKSRNERFTWYMSTSIEYEQPVGKMNARYCSMVLYFAKNNILINLLVDLDQKTFFHVCRSFTFDDLEYAKFEFE